jgi:hypothetical protein
MAMDRQRSIMGSLHCQWHTPAPPWAEKKGETKTRDSESETLGMLGMKILYVMCVVGVVAEMARH